MKALYRAITILVALGAGGHLLAQPVPIPGDTGAPAAPAAPAATAPSTPATPATPVVTDTIPTPAVQPQLIDLIPTYPVENMPRALEFYTNRLGFSIVLQSGGTYSSVGRDYVQIGLALSKGAAKGPKSSSYINMTAIDAFYKEVVARGVKVARELKTQPSKMREFSVVDPDGNSLTFGEYTGPK